MLDNKGRILVPREFKVINSPTREIYFYYEPEEQLFYMLCEEFPRAYSIGIRKMDEKNRVHVPKEIVEIYKTTNILCVKKEGKVYLLPIKEV